MIVPPQQSQSWIKWILRLGGSNLVIPAHSKNQERCLDFFLEEYKDTLCSKFLMDSLFQKLVDDLLHLFQQLEHQKICQDDYFKGDTRPVKKFKEVSITICM